MYNKVSTLLKSVSASSVTPPASFLRLLVLHPDCDQLIERVSKSPWSNVRSDLKDQLLIASYIIHTTFPFGGNNPPIYYNDHLHASATKSRRDKNTNLLLSGKYKTIAHHEEEATVIKRTIMRIDVRMRKRHAVHALR